jgi:hypothetical protein
MASAHSYGYAGHRGAAGDGDEDDEDEDDDHDEDVDEDDDDEGMSAHHRWRSTESSLHALASSTHSGELVEDRSSKRAGLRQRLPSKRHDDEEDDDEDGSAPVRRRMAATSGAKTGRGGRGAVRRAGSEDFPSYGFDPADSMSFSSFSHFLHIHIPRVMHWAPIIMTPSEHNCFFFRPSTS